MDLRDLLIKLKHNKHILKPKYTHRFRVMPEFYDDDLNSLFIRQTYSISVPTISKETIEPLKWVLYDDAAGFVLLAVHKLFERNTIFDLSIDYLDGTPSGIINQIFLQSCRFESFKLEDLVYSKSNPLKIELNVHVPTPRHFNVIR